MHQSALFSLIEMKQHKTDNCHVFDARIICKTLCRYVVIYIKHFCTMIKQKTGFQLDKKTKQISGSQTLVDPETTNHQKSLLAI